RHRHVVGSKRQVVALTLALGDERANLRKPRIGHVAVHPRWLVRQQLDDRASPHLRWLETGIAERQIVDGPPSILSQLTCELEHAARPGLLGPEQGVGDATRQELLMSLGGRTSTSHGAAP